MQGCPYSSPASLNCPQRNTFLCSYSELLLVPSPHFHSSVSLYLKHLGMKPMGPRAPPPCAPTLAGGGPGPWSLTACPCAHHRPVSSGHSSQRLAQLGQGQMPAFLLALGPSALPLFLFPFVYGTRSSSQAMRKCSAPGQLEFVSRKIAQEFRAGARSQACWAACFVLSGPSPAGGPAGTNPRQSGVSRMLHSLPSWEETEQQSPVEVRDRLCKFSLKIFLLKN